MSYKENLNVQKLDLICWEILVPSARVDFCLFVSALKPAVRTKLIDIKKINDAKKTFDLLGWFSTIDKQGYCVVAQNANDSKLIMETDQSTTPHEKKLGKYLGYPTCCFTHCAALGENSIDEYADLFKQNLLLNEFKLIDIRFYEAGIALISHIPCSPTCEASLKLAKIAKNFIETHKNTERFSEWASKILDHF